MKKITLTLSLAYIIFALAQISRWDKNLWAYDSVVSPASSFSITGVTVASQTAIACQTTRLLNVSVLAYANLSSSDTVFFKHVSTANVAATGFPIPKNSSISIEVNPLKANVTFYFQAQDGSTGAQIRCLQGGDSGPNL